MHSSYWGTYLSKKAFTVGILLFIFLVGNSLVVGYNIDVDMSPFVGNFLMESLNKHNEPTYPICKKNHLNNAIGEKSVKSYLLQKVNDIDCSLVDLLEFYMSFNPYSYLMITTVDQDEGYHDRYAKASYDAVKNSTVCGYIIDNTTKEPIKGARVIIFWSDHQDIAVNYSYSDSLGFYSIDLKMDEVLLVVRAGGYFSQFLEINDFEEDETIWYNASLNPGAPLENSIVCGFITDNLTDDPIGGADVICVNYADSMPYDWNYTCTNSSGFYSIDVSSTVGDAYFYSDSDGYYSSTIVEYNISENETLWINLSLNPRRPENSTVCGYITDNVNGEPIENAEFDIYWNDDQGNNVWNHTCTDSYGFYSINVAAGKIAACIASAVGYFSEFMGDYNISENETLWINVSLYPIPPKTSIVCGYITDETTKAPIENANVDLYWNDDQDHNVWNYTCTDSYGFYSINVAAGEINMDVEADGYSEEHTESYEIGEYESLDINITMQFIINENSIVCGYVKDVETVYPIIDAFVSLHWHDDKGHSYWKHTFTDSSGFYNMMVAAGEIYIHAYAYEYLCEYTEDYEIDEYDTSWINVSMQCEVIEVNITKPLKALYVANYRVMPLLLKSVIYGNIDIEVDTSDDTSFVEFRVDGKIRATDDSEPYAWTWDTNTMLKHRHKIEVMAYGRFGSSAKDEITVIRFF